MVKINKSAIILFFIFVFSSFFSFSQQDSKKQIQELLALKDDTNKVNALNDYLWKLDPNDTVNIFLIAKESINLSKKLNYIQGLATAQKNVAKYFYYNGQYTKALDLYKLSLKNYDSCNYKKGIAISYKNIGNVYSSLGITKEALKNYFKSLELREEIQDTLGIAKTFSAIGNEYTNTEDYKDSAIIYFERALDIFLSSNSIYNITSTYIKISSFYYSFYKANPDSSNFQLTINYAHKGIALSKEYNLFRFEGTAYEILGEAYKLKGEKDSAYFYLNKSLEVRKEDNNIFGIVNSLNKLGYFFLLSKKYSKAKNFLNQALELSLKIGSEQISQDIYSNLSSLYSQTGNYKKAYSYFLKYTILKDSLSEKQNTKQLTQIAMQYEFDKKQKIQELEQEKKDEMTQAEIKRQRVITYFLIAGLMMMLILAFVIFRSYKQKQKTNKLLREKNVQINIKNVELNQRNEEIEAQRDEIEAQKEEIIIQRDFLDKSNKEITASINYARRIQQAVLTPISFFEKNFKEFFILFKPRDIVSGDFYWATKIEDKIIVTAADSTGHGVPGAFMSLLGISFLNQIVNEQFDRNRKNFNAANILNKLRDMIVLSLGHGDENNQQQEGMDMALTIIDYKENKLEYAGAYNPLIIVKNNELKVISADRMPVGYHFRKMNVLFTNHIISFEKDSMIYMFSDGFQDQFGGIEAKKYTIKKLKQNFIEYSSLDMNSQKEKLSNIFYQWTKGDNIQKEFSQIDDILIMGIKL